MNKNTNGFILVMLAFVVQLPLVHSAGSKICITFAFLSASIMIIGFTAYVFISNGAISTSKKVLAILLIYVLCFCIYEASAHALLNSIEMTSVAAGYISSNAIISATIPLVLLLTKRVRKQSVERMQIPK